MSRKPGNQLKIGPLSPVKGSGEHWVQPPMNFPTPVTVCNANSTGLYTGTTWNLRPGAEDHKRWPSRGTGC